MPYTREEHDAFQRLVTASYGSPVNANGTVDGIEFRNPLDNGILATIGNDQAVDISNVSWTEGVEHDDSRQPEGWQGWNSHMNRTTDEHRPTPKPDTDQEAQGDEPGETPEQSAETTPEAGTPTTPLDAPSEPQAEDDTSSEDPTVPDDNPRQTAPGTTK